MEEDFLTLNLEDINCVTEIGEGRNFVSYLSTMTNDSSKYVSKFVKDIDEEYKFIKYVELIKETNHPGIIPFIGFCKSNENSQHKNVIIFKFAENFSLQHVFNLIGKGKTLDWWNIERKYLFIYGIAQTMNYLHSLMRVHKALTPSNILIDENFEPQISDFSQSMFFPKFEFTNENMKKYNLIYYTDPYILKNNGRFHQKSDVFSFAIIALQILSGSVEIYEEFDNLDELIEEIKNGLMPIFPDNIPDEMNQLLASCLSLEIKNRPLFSVICNKLEKIYESIHEISSEKFKEYKEKITGQSEKEELNPQIKKMKDDALAGDVEMMYLYAKARLEGNKCKKKITEAIQFFRMASNKGHPVAKDQLSLLTHNDESNSSSIFITSIDDINNKKEEEANDLETNNIYINMIFRSLIDDPYFDKPKRDIDELLNDVDIQIENDEKIDFNKEEVKKQNFIFTKGAEDRLQKLYNYIKVGVPVLLEGPTGTSKTLSSEIVCKLLGRELIRFNLSSETKTQDLIGRYVGDENSWAGITQKDGPFYQAFKEGKVLLLDEINLASASVLQCIEESLDSGTLSIEIPGRPLVCVQMDPNFRVIATQNPNKGSYANKRQNLGLKFYSRFQVINFPAFTEDELLQIAEGLAYQFDYKEPGVIKSLVSFHKEWSENPAIADDPQCFTIREIAATVKALSQNEGINDTIMTIYGARYQKKLKDQLTDVLSKYPNLTKGNKKFEFPNFPNCYQNESLCSAVKSTLFSLHNGRNVILTGKEGCGKTQVAMWIADYYNKEKVVDDGPQKTFFCVCTEEIKVSDLVGHQAPSGKSDGTSELIKWQDGFLTKAIMQGKCSVLESLDEAPSTVTERLNGLLDQKYDGQKKFFDIPENSANPRVEIKDSFRILATSNIDKISQMSPAFLNRFDIIVLENQIDDSITEIQFHNLITILMNRCCSDMSSKPKISASNLYETNAYDIDKKDDVNISGDDDKENDNNAKPINNELESYKYSPSIIPKIYDKIKNERNISNISKVCNSIFKLSSVLNENNNENTETQIVDFAFSLIQNNHQFEVPRKFERKLINMLRNDLNTNDECFFYEDSPSLCNFLVKLMAYSIISQPVCVTGPTGVGKTSSARAFSRMRPRSSSNKNGFQMHSFHSGTKVSHLFGSTTLLDGKIVFHDGSLTKALKSGIVFIADELNLSTQSVMKSLSLALDPTIGKNVFIPGTGEIINISPEFHFIACQNEIGTLGRNAIPDSIASRFVYINYPTPYREDIEKICISLSKKSFDSLRKYKDEDEEFAKNIADYMIRINESKLTYIQQWSLRDITKIFKRIYTQNNKKMFLNIKPIHHVLFYTMSSVAQNDVENVIDEVSKMLKLSFNLNDNEVTKYIDCYKATPKIENKEGSGYFMMKGDFGISINSMNVGMTDNSLTSFLNARFNVYLCEDEEPILLMGNSGFKTFLAKTILDNAKDISLNQETNVAQLLGSSVFLTKSEAKLFYIEYICKIIQKDNEIFKLRESWEKGELTKEQVDEKVKAGKSLDELKSFHYALQHLADKLLNDDKKQNCVLSNTTLEFRPGLLLNAILQGKSLILKDLSNLPTIVLERFNELFSGKHILTLSEDIHNTFTKADKKELKFKNSFGVFATCPANSPSRLSEAVLSRFTVISVPEYTKKEQEIVLKSYIQTNDLQFDFEDINKLNDFSIAYSMNLKTHISFPQMIKIVDIASKLNHETSKLIKNSLDMSINSLKTSQNDVLSNFQKINIGITLFRVLGGLIDSEKKKQMLFNTIKDYFEIPEIFNDQKEECQLVITSKNGISGVLSNVSNLFIQCSSAHECKTKVAFTKSFNDLLDLLHMGLAIHNPIILEGPPGQGKHTAINFIAEMLNINVIHIMISQSTKYEDLFGKNVISREKDGIHVNMVETQFVKIIKSYDSFDKPSLIVLENINYASPALLNALVPVFNANSSSILLPNGSTTEKGKFDIIGIFNTQQTSSSKDKLPSTIINSSIYHIVPLPNKNEILSIILSKFSLAGLPNEEAEKFNSYYTQAKKVILTEGTSGLFTLNDVEKYILFRKLTKDIFHETTISQMIFAYRFSSDEMIQKMLKTLNLENMIFTPLFDYDASHSNLFIRISNDDVNGLLIPLISSPKNIDVLADLDSLTLPQKHCLIFLGCSLLSKRSCVIQGDTASGKSHLIRLFAKILGAKLNVFQMNSDSDISMLAGQSVLNNSISQNDQENFKKAFTDLKVDDSIRKYLNDPKNIDISNPKSWTPKELKKLLEFIQSIEIDIKCSKYCSEIENAVQLIKETMNPVNRFEHQESAFINAIRKGEWVLIDGIESAPSVIAEKISSLCGEKPELNLYEYGPKFYFSKDNIKPENRIHDNFQLFITYNPNYMKESQMIDQTFIVKSVTFTLPIIDERIENSAQMLLGSFLNLSFRNDLSKELAARFASMHQFAKIVSKKNPDDFAGDVQFNGRTLKFLSKSFMQQNLDSDLKALSKSICLSIKSLYWNSYINGKNEKDFHSSCLKKFKEKPKKELITCLQAGDMSFRDRNEPVLLTLRNIQKCVFGTSTDSIYTLSTFLELCLLIRISDLSFIQEHILDTIRIIESKSNEGDDKIRPSIKYGTLYALCSLFDSIIKPALPIKKEHTFLSLKDQELKNNLSIVSELLKLDLLKELLKENLFSENSSILLGNKLYLEIISKVSNIASNFKKELIVDLFRQVQIDNDMIYFFDLIFPYLKFKNTANSMIAYWIPLSKSLISNGIRFSYTINDQKIEFNTSSTIDFIVNLQMNNANNFSITTAQLWHNRKRISKVEEHPENQNESFDLVFYWLIINYSKNLTDLDYDEIRKYWQSRAKNDYKNQKITNPSVDSILSLKDLYIKNDISLIGIIWNTIFTLSKDKIVELSHIIHPIEADLLISAHRMYLSINQDLIKDIVLWSKWASYFEINAKILWNIHLMSSIKLSQIEIDDNIKILNDVILYLRKSPEKMNDYCPSKKYVDICETELTRLKEMKVQNDKDRKSIEIQKKIEKLKNILLNHKINEKFNQMRAEFVNQLGNITDYTDEKYNFAYKMVHQFINEATVQLENHKDSNIIWPQSNCQDFDSTNMSENIKLFDCLIWYSRIKSILKKINKGKDIMKNLWKLNDFPEMEGPRLVLLENLIKNTKTDIPELSRKDKDQALFTLNAHMILKLYKINHSFLTDPDKISKTINKYIERNSNDEREIKWIYKKLSEFPSDLVLSIPKFEINDLVFLLVNKKSRKKFNSGPLLHGFDKNIFYKDLKKLMHVKFDSYEHAAKSICQIAYKNFIDPDSDAPDDYNKLKDSFTNRGDSSKSYILKRFSKIFEFAKYLEKWKDQTLRFDDISFLSDKWTNDMQLLNQFPSLLFWLYKHKQCSDQIIKRYHDYEFKDNEIPLWLLAIRILSSMNCISFDYNSNPNQISTIIEKTISKSVIDYINDKKGKSLNYDWMSILLSNLPLDIANPTISIFHDFFINLALDNHVCSSFIDEKKNRCIEESVSKVVSIILDNKGQDLITENIENKNSIIAFLAFPSKYVQDKIKDYTSSSIDLILSNKATIKLKDFLGQSDKLNEIICNLQSAIKDDEEKMKNYFEEKSKQEYEQKRKKKIRDIKSNVEKYNEIIDLLSVKNEQHTNEIVAKGCNKLNEIKQEIKNYNLFLKEVAIQITCLEYHYKERKFNFKKTQIFKYYLLPGESYHQNVNFAKDCLIKEYTLKYPKIDPNFDYEQIQINKNYASNIPKIYFGLYHKSSFQFIYDIKEIDKMLKSLEKDFFDILTNSISVKYHFFDYLRRIDDLLNDLKINNRAEFSDNSQAKKTEKILQENLCEYINYLQPLIKNVKHLSDNPYSNIPWKILKDIEHTKLFKYQYDIQIPKLDCSSRKTFSFSKIENINSLASPIISISQENKIICSVKKLKCAIGPLFPSNICNPYSINIISFINDDVQYEIDNLSDQQFSKIITTKYKTSRNKSIQIFVIPPASKKDPEILKINGDLIIKMKSSQPFSLPFEVSIAILPLKVRIHCLNYKLTDYENNMKLCCEKIISGSKIDFEAKNYYNQSYFVLAVELESLDENEADQPNLSINKINQTFSIKIPEVTDPIRCKFIIKVALSQNLVTSILCDFIILPFAFTFEVYNYMTKRFESNCQLIYINSFCPLFFKIMTLFPSEQTCKLDCVMPRNISISSSNNEFTHKFQIKGDHIINAKISYIGSAVNYYPNKYYVSLSIRNITKKIYFQFIKPSFYVFRPFSITDDYQNQIFIDKFPCIEYDYNIRNWIKIKDAKKINKNQKWPSFICSPFQYYTDMEKFTIINYSDDKKVEYVSSSNDGKVTYLQMTYTAYFNLIFTSNNESTKKLIKKPSKIWFKPFQYYYYSVIGYLNENNKCWFPVFNEYPDLTGIDEINYSNDAKTIEQAEKNIKKMYQSLDEKKKIKHDKVDTYFHSKTEFPLKKMNFALMMLLLDQQTIYTNISDFINQFPSGIKRHFVDFHEKLNIFLERTNIPIKDISMIILHNLIVKFARIFKAKFEEIKSHQFCLESPFSIPELYQAILKMESEYYAYDKSLNKKRSNADNYEFSEKEKAMAKIPIDPLPDKTKQYDCFIVSENDLIKPCALNELSLGSFHFDDNDVEETIISNDIDSLVSLPPIEIPKEYTIESLNAFYSSCSQGATALPSYIRLRQIQSKDQDESENYFLKLLNIYNYITKSYDKNHSILANHINSFIESFKNCVRRLRRAGIDFSRSHLHQSLKDNLSNFQDFIKCPDINYPILRKNQWKTKNQRNNDFMKFVDPLFNKGKMGLTDVIKTDSIDNQFNYPNYVDEQPSEKSIEVVYHEIGNEEKQLIIAQVIGDNDDEENDSKDLSDDEKNQTISNKPTLRIVEHSKMEIVNPEDINGIFTDFTEKDSINRVLRRIKEMKKDAELEFLSSSECIIQNQNDLFRSSATSFPVENLVILSQNLIANLIAKASDSKCPFLDISCNLLIDCSSFICVQNKLYNFMILIAYSYALSALEIPFSIAIVADLRFRFVLKPFEEEISILVLQRILDCLLIQRYKTNIADTFRHSLEFMKCPDEKRTQRALFIFSDGIDENLVLSQSWKEKLLNDPNNSFAMIFVKSKLLENEGYSVFQSMWDSFSEDIETAPSITKLIYINPDLNSPTIESIISIFCTVLSRQQNSSNLNFYNKLDQKPEFKHSYDDFSKDKIENIKLGFNYNFDEGSSSIFRKINPRFTASGSRFPMLDVGHYRNKTGKMTYSSPSQLIKEEFDQFIYRIVYSKRNSYRPLLETIFKPNKASQTVLSSTGTDFDITALVLNLINPVPDPLIYLEEKGGLIRNYGISIIIDSSRSCFNQLSSSHSYQTIMVFLTALASIDIPCVDVIIARNEVPIVLASEIPSLRLFNDKSTFWPSLFNCLSEDSFGCCSLEAAIHAAFDIRRMRSVDSTSYMFVLTDGLFQYEQKELIRNHIMTCIQSDIRIFGIGIGIYPSGIVDLFPQVIFATNPNDLIQGIASCFSDETNDSYENIIKQLAPEPPSPSDVSRVFQLLNHNEKNPIFRDLKKYLSENAPPALDAFADWYNKEQEQRNADNELVNPKGLDTEMFVKDFLEGQKILIVMLYDCTINNEEKPIIAPEYLFKTEFAGEEACVKKAVEHFGIEIIVVGNYKDAINELTKQTIPNKCDYYATWVISGLPFDMKLPDGGNQHLVDQFIDCLIQFWEKGGSVVLFAESDPLTFQANKFLEKVTFPDGRKTQLRLSGNHHGTKILKGDPSGLLNIAGTFNKSPLDFQKCQRAPLSHNLVEIYEGETISYAPNDESQYKPFTPFMRDSENGISALFYPGDKDPRYRRGDIIVDCGYTKLFDKMTTNGTFRYIQNIAGWTAQCESRSVMRIKPKDFRPEAIIFTIDENARCNLIKLPQVKIPKNIKIDTKQIQKLPAKTQDLSALDSIDSIKSISTFNTNFDAILKAERIKLNGRKDNELKEKFEQLFDRLKESGHIDPETNRRIKMLIGLAAGNIQNVFYDKNITAIINH